MEGNNTNMQAAPPSVEVLAQSRALLDVQGDPAFGQLLGAVAQAANAVQGVQVVSQETYESAAGLLVQLRGLESYVGDWMARLLRLPKLYEQCVRAALTPITSQLTLAIDTLLKKAEPWAQALHAQRQEAEKAAAATVTPGGVEQARPIDGGVKEQAAPAGATVQAPGGTVYGAESEKVVVTEPLDVLKAIISSDKKYDHCTLDLVKFDLAAIKRVLKTSKRNIPGVTADKSFGLRTRKGKGSH